MYIRSFLQDKQMTITLSGEIDHHEAKHAIKTITEKIDSYLPRVCTLDFRDVTFMDSSGIAVLLRTCRRMREMDGQFQVIQVPRQAGRVLRAAGLQNMMPIAFSGEEE